MKMKIVEAVLFASDEPVEWKKISEIIPGTSFGEISSIINELNDSYERYGHTFRIVEVAGGFQFETLPQYGEFVQKLFSIRSKPKLSRAALETMAIVAYKQPISKQEIDSLRGVDSDASIRTLQNRLLIEIKGRGEAVGKPLLYGTTQEFLRYFGLNELKDLPGADEIASMFDGTEIPFLSPDQLSLADSLTVPDDLKDKTE